MEFTVSPHLLGSRNRKGVLKVLYNLKVSGKWATSHENENLRTTGAYNFEPFDEEPEVVVSVDPRCKSSILGALARVVTVAAKTFLRELRVGVSQALGGLSTEKPKPSLPESHVTDFFRSGIDATNKVNRKRVRARKKNQ